MSEPFIGEIRAFGFSWAPRGWIACNGGTIPASENPALYALIGNYYGGNPGRSAGIPDLRGRAPVHRGTGGYNMGVHYGFETVTLEMVNMPEHTHGVNASPEPGNASIVGTNSVLAGAQQDSYGTATNLVEMNSGTCSTAGGGQSHANMQPYQVVGFCMALEGLFPSRN